MKRSEVVGIKLNQEELLRDSDSDGCLCWFGVGVGIKRWLRWSLVLSV